MPSSTSFPPSCTEPALEIESLTGPAEQPRVHDISLRLSCGCKVVVLGPNHSGKSSILRHVLGLDRASHGRVTVGDDTFDASAPPTNELRRIRVRVGAVFEGSALLQRISVVENVELPLLEHTSERPEMARQRARELLSEVGLQVDDEEMPDALTRADERRVALARALALQPIVLVLDEPTAGLDAPAAHELDATVTKLQARYGFGVLVLTREARHAFGRVDEIDVLVDGRIVARGDRERVLESEHPVVRRLLHRRGEEAARANGGAGREGRGGGGEGANP
jgi:ABC-type transporter Mla maintaining outer membrane lipid asymmetry ATPase subunit MlaF